MSTAVAQILEVVEFCRDRGVTVTFEPGWETRGNGYSAQYVGGLVHHTASNSSASNPCPTRRILIEGRSDLSGPLSQFQTCWNGVLHVIAAHPSNHGGASGGRSMGPLPVTNLFNPRVMGNEIDYSGSVPMTAPQYRTSAVWGAAVATVLAGGDVEYIRAHAETSITGKWDPGYTSGKTIDMARFRADCRQHLAAPRPTPEPKPTTRRSPEMFLFAKRGADGKAAGGTRLFTAAAGPVTTDLTDQNAAEIGKALSDPSHVALLGPDQYTLLAKAMGVKL